MNDYPEFDTARTPVKVLLEADVQESCVEYARGLGWWARKLSSPQNRGIMDYLFGKNGLILLVEFKRPGRFDLSKDQEEEHKKARACGLNPVVMNDIERFKKWLNSADSWLRCSAGAETLHEWTQWFAKGHEPKL